jgi:cytochrome P450
MWRSLSPIPAWIERLTGGTGPTTVERTELPELYEVLARLVRERRSQSADDGDLVSMLATATDPATGERMTDEQVCEELVTLFVAATETASAALTWTFHELARHPDIEARVHDEVDSVLGGGLFTAPDVGKLGYTRRVVQEVLRRYAAWLLMRRVVAPVELAGIELVPGAEVYYSPYALHHDPRLYPEPDVFDPDRWLPERFADLPRGAFIPFGAGNRLCMGEGYAWAELVIVLAAVTARWRLAPAPGHEVRPRVGTLIEADRLPMTLHKRH